MSPVTTDSVLERFRQSGALLEGHFRLTSGLHSPGLSAMRPGPAASGPMPRPAGRILPTACGAWARRRAVAGARRHRDWAGSRPCARHPAIFAERQDGTLMLRRGFTLAPGDQGPGRRGRRHDWRVDARDDRRGARGRGAGRWRSVDHRSQRRAAEPRRAVSRACHTSRSRPMSQRPARSARPGSPS